MSKAKVKAWSVAAEVAIDKARRAWKDRHGGAMPPEIEAKIIEQAHDQAVADVYGADWKQHVDAQGKPQEQGIGSTLWLLRVSEDEAELHYSALSRYRGPAAAVAERERIARLKGKK
jgi:RNA 3'-terminal phosphate cyclase